jgi:hypothetical protein
MKLLKMADPVAVTKSAVGLAGSTVGLAGSGVGLAGTVARDTAHIALSGLHLHGGTGGQRARTGQTGADAASDLTGPPANTAADIAGTDAAEASSEPTIVPVESHAPDEPPVDVVGQPLAAEAALGDREIPEGAGLAHEPRGASRDEEHADAAMQRAEVDGIAEEVTAALEGDAEPEEHLTEPLPAPGEAKARAAEMRTRDASGGPAPGVTRPAPASGGVPARRGASQTSSPSRSVNAER